MARRILLGALCVLFATSAVLAASERSFPSFSAQLRPSKPEASVKTASAEEKYEKEDYYEGPKICLKEAARDQCINTLDNQPLVGRFFTSKVTCCNEDDYGYGGYDKKSLFLEKKVYSPAIGSCDFASVLFDNDIEVVPGVTYKAGTSTITCTFYDGAEKCDSELCDGMTFTVEATIYTTKAYSHRAPAVQGVKPSGIACNVIPDNVGNAVTAMAQAEAKSESKVATASYEKYDKYEEDYDKYYDSYRNSYYDEYAHVPEPIYYGTATIFSGLVTAVSSPKHHAKYLGGKFEFVADYYNYQAGPVSPVPVVDNYQASWISGTGFNIELTKLGKY